MNSTCAVNKAYGAFNITYSDEKVNFFTSDLKLKPHFEKKYISQMSSKRVMNSTCAFNKAYGAFNNLRFNTDSHASSNFMTD